MELKYDPQKHEPAIQKFWDSKNIYKKLKKRLAKATPYFFLDGPPYTTGAIHIGHAWNYSLKDCYRRYLRMRGFNVNDTPGFDTHGLPIEVKVEKKLGIRNKQEIVEKIGMAKFAEECQNFALENMHPMIKDFERLGVWMDWDNPYITFKNYYIEGAWWALKKTHENGFLYEGEKVMTWCPRCGTALAKHELEYKDVADESIFVKFKIANSENEFLIVWTTTPWTIPFDLAVMVHPEFEYAKVKVGDEIWIIAKDLVEKVTKTAGKQNPETVQIVKGRELEGIKYLHPMAEIIPELKELSKKAKVHTVILTEKYIDLQTGTGLVHSAPGCGPEDYEVCKSYGIPAYNTIDEFGNFPTSMGPFAGLTARKDDAEFVKHLENNNILIGKTKITHEYAHCWRCYTGIVYKLTSQWFLATEKLRQDMLAENSKTYWTPGWAGSEWFTSWLDNIQDWCISRQRFWGIPLPIWRCKECMFIIVAESAQELKKNSGRPPQNLHRPWIDEVILKCKQCKGPMHRVPDVMDVWLDSGAAPWASLADQKKNPDAVAEFILEGKDQIRGWFNSLMALSMVARKKTSYKSVFMHGMIADAQGRKMSKSTGNTISPYEVVDNYGADALRYYTIGGTKPGLDLNYNFKDLEAKNSNLNVLWNTHLYLIDLAASEKINPEKLKLDVLAKKLSVEDKYMLSVLNSTIKKVTELFDQHNLNEIPQAIENLYLDLSRWYIKLIRGQASESVIYVIYKTLLKTIQMLSTITPFMTEQMYQNFGEAFRLKPESVHLTEWPEADDSQINEKLEQEMQTVKAVASNILAAREKIKRNVRWPVKKIFIQSVNAKQISEITSSYSSLLKNLTNVLEIDMQENVPAGVSKKVKANYPQIEKKFGKSSAEVVARIIQLSPESILQKIIKDGAYKFKTAAGDEVELTPADLIVERSLPETVSVFEIGSDAYYIYAHETQEMLASGYTREFIRAVQALRKKASLHKPDKIDLAIFAQGEARGYLEKNLADIKEKVGAKNVRFAIENEIATKASKETITVRDKKIVFGF